RGRSQRGDLIRGQSPAGAVRDGPTGRDEVHAWQALREERRGDKQRRAHVKEKRSNGRRHHSCDVRWHAWTRSASRTTPKHVRESVVTSLARPSQSGRRRVPLPERTG